MYSIRKVQILSEGSIEAPAKESLVLPMSAANARKPTLVLDLDETLVHCSMSNFQNCTGYI